MYTQISFTNNKQENKTKTKQNHSLADFLSVGVMVLWALDCKVRVIQSIIHSTNYN